MNTFRGWLAQALVVATWAVTAGGASPSSADGINYVRGRLIELNDNGAWSWFMDPRVIVDHGRLIVGSVRAAGTYAKYASNGRDTIHFVVTEDHPRNFDNGLYHGFIRGGNIHLSDGAVLAPLATSSDTTVHAWDLTRIYQGGPTHVAWMTDLRLDERERPAVLFTVQVDGAGLPKGQGGFDHRFHYARWDGSRWAEYEIAFAGRRLYAGEDDYTGLGAIDPQQVNVVFISTDADPVTGTPLVSRADGERHREIFRGVTSDHGRTWRWLAVTANSTMDNLRPLVPVWPGRRTALVWMRGSYSNNRGEWTTKVVALILRAEDFKTNAAGLQRRPAP